MTETNENYKSRTANGLNSLSLSLLPLIRRVLGKKGMVIADLITLWDQIVGEEISACSFPEKVEFPHGERVNGTLRLKVAGGAFALEIKHREKFIVERVNAYFGYKVVSSVKIFQDANFARNLAAKSNQPQIQKILVSEEEQNYIVSQTKDIADDRLREKLTELGKKIFNRNNE